MPRPNTEVYVGERQTEYAHQASGSFGPVITGESRVVRRAVIWRQTSKDKTPSHQVIDTTPVAV